MKTRRGIACLTIMGIMVLFLCLMGSGVRAENPPPSGTHFMGPAVIANLEFTPSDITVCFVQTAEGPAPGVVFSGDADCMGQNFTISVNDSCCDVHLFDEVNKDSLKGFMFDCDDMSWVPDWCAPDVFIQGLLIQSVISYSHDMSTGVKKARVIALFVVP